MSSSEEILKKIAEALQGEHGEWANANKPFATTVEKKSESVTKPSTDAKTVKKLEVIKTDTFLDQMFLDAEDKPIGGIPSVSNSILTGLPNSGKSRLLAELALKLANSGVKVCFVTSEDAWRTESARFDLESRMRKDTKTLELNWKTISENLFVIDTIIHAELRDWSNFVAAYRSVVENEKVEILLVDSLTLLEDSRGQIKYRVLELMRYGQTHGITSIMINQRGIDEADGLAMAGGISLSHIVDTVFILDYKKAWSGDATLKMDTGCKQGDITFFFRILKCRLTKFDAHYFSYGITKDGLVRLTPKQATVTEKLETTTQ